MAPQPPRNDCCRSCLRGSLRGLNYLLAIVGVLMTAYALFMWVQWEEAKKPDTPTPPPPGWDDISHFSQRAFGMKNPADTIISDPLDGVISDPLLLQPETSVRGSLIDDNQAGKGDDPTPSPGKEVYPWFIYIFGGAGVFVFVTASIGILSADCAACGVTCFLGLYHALMVLMLLIQIIVVCFYFSDKSWESDLPDSTGEYKKLRDVVLKHIPACKIAGLATLGLQLLALMVSCSLYYAEGRPVIQTQRLDHRALDNRGPYHHLEYDAGSQHGSHAVRTLWPSNGGRYSDRDVTTRYPSRLKPSVPTREPRSPTAPPGPSRLAIANEEAAATGGLIEDDPPAAAADEETPAASPEGKRGNCAIM